MIGPEQPGAGKRSKREVRWCGDLRTVLDRGPFEPAPEAGPEDETQRAAGTTTERDAA